MRSRLIDGVVIVLLGLAVFTAAVHALPAPPEMQAVSMPHRPMLQHLGGTGRSAPHQEASAP